MTLTKKQSFALFFSYYAMVYMAASAYSPFLSVYYLSIHFTKTQIGLLAAMSSLVSIFAQPVWGMITDKSRQRKHSMYIGMAGVIFAAILYRLNNTFLFILLITVVFSCFGAVIMPVGDTIALKFCGKSGVKFSMIRLGGTIGYSISVLFAGKIISQHITNMFFIYSLLMSLTLLIVIFLPSEPGAKTGRKKLDFSGIFKNRVILFLFIYLLIVNSASAFNGSFLGVVIKEMPHGSSTQVGIASSVSALSEVPVLFLIERLLRRFKARNILLFSGVMIGLRLLIMFLANVADSVTVVYLSQTLQGVTYMTTYYCAVRIVDSEMPEQLKASGQTMLTLFTGSISGIIGNIGGGFLSDHIGLKSSYMYISLSVIAVAILFILYYRFFAKERGEAAKV